MTRSLWWHWILICKITVAAAVLGALVLFVVWLGHKATVFRWLSPAEVAGIPEAFIVMVFAAIGFGVNILSDKK